jgi:sugar lactone lactonase YvrE
MVKMNNHQLVGLIVGLLILSSPAFIYALGAGAIITTAAGTTAGFSGDNGAATAAQLNQPSGVAVDSAGNIYIADQLNHRLRKIIAASGIITTVAGTTGGFSGDNGPATTAKLSNPSGVALDTAGNLYLAEYGNHRIRKIITPTGIITTVAGSTAGFSGDNGVATAAKLNQPSGVAVDAAGNIYIADSNNNRIRKVITPTGVITTVAGSTAGFSGDNGLATSAQFNKPVRVILDGAGNLYIADQNNHRIRKVIIATGIITTVVGTTQGFSGDNGVATAAKLSLPSGLAFDSAGDLYIADTGNSRIRKVMMATGIITTVAGTTLGFSGDNGPAILAQFNVPSDVVFDGSGNLYIADQNNHRIRKVRDPSVYYLPIIFKN